MYKGIFEVLAFLPMAVKPLNGSGIQLCSKSRVFEAQRFRTTRWKVSDQVYF